MINKGFTDYSKINHTLESMNPKVNFSEMTTDEKFTYYSVTAGRYINIKWIYDKETANKIFEKACELLKESNDTVYLRYTKEILPLRDSYKEAC